MICMKKGRAKFGDLKFKLWEGGQDLKNDGMLYIERWVEE